MMGKCPVLFNFNPFSLKLKGTELVMINVKRRHECRQRCPRASLGYGKLLCISAQNPVARKLMVSFWDTWGRFYTSLRALSPVIYIDYLIGREARDSVSLFYTRF